MDEETVDAAARAISFLGEAALGARAADLVRRARGVALGAAGANADHLGVSLIALDEVQVESGGRMQAVVNRLTGAATALEQVESAGRAQAVSDLLEAATALQGALGVELDKLRGAAADLARQCHEHREATTAMEKVRRVPVERNDRIEDRPVPWWLFWRCSTRVRDLEEGRGVRQSLLLAGSTPTVQASKIVDAARIAVDFMRNGVARPDHLVELAGNIALSVHNLAMPDQSIIAARDALQQADSLSSVEAAVNDLEAAATSLDRAASAQLVTVCNPVVLLVTACREFLEASNAMAVVQRAAMERARQTESAVVPVQNAPPPPPSRRGQGDERRSAWLGYALYGSLTLAPYLVATVPKAKLPETLEDEERSRISCVLSLWWSVIASGAVCSSYARSWLEICYAQLAARVGIYGINIFAIYFFYWILGIQDTDARCKCMWFATFLHLMFLGVACSRRDP